MATTNANVGTQQFLCNNNLVADEEDELMPDTDDEDYEIQAAIRMSLATATQSVVCDQIFDVNKIVAG